MKKNDRERKLVYTGYMSANGRGEFTIGGDSPFPVIEHYHKRLTWHREVEFFFAPLIKSDPSFLETASHIIDPSRNTTRIVPAGFSAGYLSQVFEQTLSSITTCYGHDAILIVTFRETPTDPLGG